MKKIKKRIKDLQEILIYHNYLYFILNKPIISDDRYDYLFKKLQFLEKKYKIKENRNSPTNLIGFNISKKNSYTNHLTPMLSLENTFNKENFFSFYKKILKYQKYNKIVSFCCELKFDGIAVNLIYKKGILIKAFTRGDGEKGEDVTKNIFFVKNIPLILKGNNFPELIEIRGEVFMLKKDFLKLNQNNLKLNINKFSSARNLASGSLLQKKFNQLFHRKLRFVCHGFELFNYFKNIDSYYKILLKIKNWGFKISSEIFLCSSIKNIFNFYLNIKKNRMLLNFDIDGIVIKVNSLKLRKKIGFTSRSPRWAIAYKFKNKGKKTKLKNVIFQVGRTGIITPVAKFFPIKISGVTVRKASLYNKSEMNKLNLYVGSKVYVCRAGDVIPKIIRVKNKLNQNSLNKISFPLFCPSCNSILKSSLNGKRNYCSNYFFCLDQIKKRLIHFFSKTSLSIDSLGPKIINQLVEKNKFYSPIDFLNLNEKILKSLNYVGNKTTKKILNSLNKFKLISLDKFIFSFGIKGVGKNVSKKLAFFFKDINNLISAHELDFLKISGIGKKISRNLFCFFSNFKNQNIIKKYSNSISKFSLINKLKKNKRNSFFYNKKILITGKLKNFSRNEIIKKLRYYGVEIKKSVSNKLDFVVQGKNPGINLIKSKKLGVRIIKQKKFFKFLYKNKKI
ncbi:MAG: NAD-dependent DNA ligase LigA [Buchnera aphidicola (Periphyllus lyropictus)]|uniref:NAD-dependent DNA ligase LigA n=1 Tax=Buchnera aphidicola TaxID=9 RepID=UPI001EBCE32C|nr:NAD-dependent DNA ligase LigA [Buchnera aphidicola]NIH16756.1 NAD-dependent DNA ligase LigA [Buchnera aphidicola (Periphyllus lyropictus)]USS94657.1 NAD-dependent DNA ligase LigA [Buchnera aphidicola (Periphyllus lyropictus)]